MARPAVRAKRRRFLRRIRAIPVDRLVFVDESGVHAAMSRSHTWVKRGTEFIDPVPMNWGKTLTLDRRDSPPRLGGVADHVCHRQRRAVRRVAHHPPAAAAAGRRRWWSWTTCGPIMTRAWRRGAARAASACCTCRHTRPTSTRLRPAGPSRNNISARTRRAHPTTCAEWPAAPAIASHPTIATSGSLMRVTKLNSGDRWG